MKVICAGGLHPEGRTAYRAFFSSIKPSFIGSRIFFSATEQLELVDQYDVGGSKVIYRHPDQVNTCTSSTRRVQPAAGEVLPAGKTKKSPSTGESVSSWTSREPEVLPQGSWPPSPTALRTTSNSRLRKGGFGSIVCAYHRLRHHRVVGPPRDRRLHRLPLGDKPIYLVHGKYGQCQTNVIFSNEEARSTVPRFRPLSGRPLD